MDPTGTPTVDPSYNPTMEPSTDFPSLSPGTTQPTTPKPTMIVTIDVNSKTADNNEGQNDHEREKQTSLTPTKESNDNDQIHESDSFNVFGLSKNNLSFMIIGLIALLCITCIVCSYVYKRQSKRLQFAREKLDILNKTLYLKNANANGVADEYTHKNRKREQEGFIKNRSKSQYRMNNKKPVGDRNRCKSHLLSNKHGGNIEKINIALKMPHPFHRIVSQSPTEFINGVNTGMVHNNVDATMSSRVSQYSPNMASQYDVNDGIEVQMMSPSSIHVQAPFDDTYDADNDDLMYGNMGATPVGPDTDEGTETDDHKINEGQNDAALNNRSDDDDEDIWADPEEMDRNHNQILQKQMTLDALDTKTNDIGINTAGYQSD